MAWFIKTEKFSLGMEAMESKVRDNYLAKHRAWVNNLNEKGIKIVSGYLADKTSSPGGGGLLFIESNSYETAKSIVEEDPLILAGLVTWKIQEWIPVAGHLKI